MKRLINILFRAFLAVLLLNACTKEESTKEAFSKLDDSKEIHFLNTSITKEFPKGSTENYVDVVLVRNGNIGERKVVLQLTGANASVFSLRDTVVLADGQYSATVKVGVDLSRIVVGSSATASLYILERDVYLGENPSFISQYSDKLSLKVSQALEWEPLMRTGSDGKDIQQTATYYYSQFYEGADGGLLVEKAKDVDGIYRLLDWAAGVPLLFKINQDNSCVIPSQSVGYEDVLIADLAVYLGDDSYYSSYPCTFDGKSTFTFNVIYYTPDGYYGFGEETLVFDTEEDTTATVSILADSESSTLFHIKAGEYCSKYVVGVCSGDISADKKASQMLMSQIAGGSAGYLPLQIFENDADVTIDAQVGANTLFVLPYDLEGNAAANLTLLPFVYDPEGLNAPDAEIVLSPSDSDPYTMLQWKIKTENALTVKYFIYSKNYIDYLIESDYYTIDYIMDNFAASLSNEYVTEANSPDGLTLYMGNKDEGKEYRMMVKVYNSYGQSKYVTATARTESHADVFDETKNIDDFVGSFLANADAFSQTSSETSECSFRVDVIKQDDNQLLLTGFCQEKDYCPSVIGTYLPDKHCVRINAQTIGSYDENYTVKFGYAGEIYSAVWTPEAAIEIGYNKNGTLYMRGAGDNPYGIEQYAFMLFLQDGSYARYTIGGMKYSNLRMKKIK